VALLGIYSILTEYSLSDICICKPILVVFMITLKTTNDDRVHRWCWEGLGGGLWGYEWREGVVCHRGWELKRWIKTRDGGGSLLFQSRSSEKWFDGRAAVSSRATESLIKSLSLNPSRTHCLGLYPLVLRRRRFLLSNLFLRARSPRRSKTQQISRLWSPRPRLRPLPLAVLHYSLYIYVCVCVRWYIYISTFLQPSPVDSQEHESEEETTVGKSSDLMNKSIHSFESISVNHADDVHCRKT